jgi:tetratricopeptide (TPR) repeat protein
MFSQIGIYRLLWVNPKPEVAVKALRFANPARSAVPVLLGLTAAIQKDQKPQAPEAAAKAQDLLAQATKTSDAGQTDKAIGLLRQAIGADPTLAAAHQMLGELCERSGDEEAALKAYQAWIQAGAQTPLPYNRTGQILEKRKDFKGALEAYTQSLKVEWNQPWTIEGKARMEKMLAGQK